MKKKAIIIDGAYPPKTSSARYNSPMNKTLSLKEFKKHYGTHKKCLEVIRQMRFPDGSICPGCERETTFHPVTGRTSYACQFCGHHVYPLAGTIFEGSTTPLDMWFFAMYLMVQTRSGISAKQLERMLGVTYKTAWRMFKQIRILMAQSPSLLEGDVEVDETYFGGSTANERYQFGEGVKGKIPVVGMVERGGKAYTKQVKSTGTRVLVEQIKQNVNPKARVITDNFGSYRGLVKIGFKHESINHSKEGYKRDDIYTQNIESLWSTMKRGIYGVYRIVSVKYLQAYVDEYTWRFNNRLLKGEMFGALLNEIPVVRVAQPVLEEAQMPSYPQGHYFDEIF